jgi:hypothetical protein
MIYILSSRLLSKNVTIKIYKITILPVVLYGYENLSDIKGRAQSEGIWEQCAELNIWMKKGWNNSRLEKTA